MKCPACKDTLIVVERERIELDWCSRCHGLWFDEGELELLAQRSGRQFDPADIGRRRDESTGEAARDCPRCDQSMVKVRVGGPGPEAVVADRCDAHGIWLDRGELGTVLTRLPRNSETDEALILRFLGETIHETDHEDDSSDRSDP